MNLHLIIPGLFRPLNAWMKDYDWKPNADALANLLDSVPRMSHDKHLYEVTAHLLGWNGDQLSVAAYRAGGQGVIAPQESDWVCADPIHIRTDANSAVVMDSCFFDLRLDEAQELTHFLETQLEADGWHFHLGAADKWYLQTPLGEAPDWIWIDQVAGKDLRQVHSLMSGHQSWRTRLTEIQMLLYQHPVNLAREARGVPIINSLWFWGKGHKTSLMPSGVGCVFASNDVCVGLANAAGIPTQVPTPEALDLSIEEDYLVFIDSLNRPATTDDLPAWQAELDRLDSEWFSLISDKLDSHSLSRVHFYTENYQWIIRPKRFLHRWKRTQPLVRSLGVK